MYITHTNNNVITFLFCARTLPGDLGEPSVGDVVLGMFKEVIPGQALLLTTPHGIGRVDITDIADHYMDHPLDSLNKKRVMK